MATRTKVLVVDNDLDTLSKVYLALIHRNYKVEASDRAAEITERLKRFKPDLLILGKKEFEAMEEMKRIPVLIILAKDELEHPPESAAILQKPFSVETLIKTVQELVL